MPLCGIWNFFRKKPQIFKLWKFAAKVNHPWLTSTPKFYHLHSENLKIFENLPEFFWKISLNSWRRDLKISGNHVYKPKILIYTQKIFFDAWTTENIRIRIMKCLFQRFITNGTCSSKIFFQPSKFNGNLNIFLLVHNGPHGIFIF